MEHVRVPVLAPLPQAPDDDVVPVEAGVVCALDDRPGDGGRQWRAAAGSDVEALVDASAVPRSSELADRPARPVWSTDREEVAVELDAARLLLVAARDRHDHPVRAVGDQPPAVGQTVPPDGLS